jgi:hypothetical protein
MMVKLLVYGYCTGKTSSRKLEKATWEDVAYRVLSGNQQPDHDSIADFRRRHLKALAGLFVQVLKLCHAAGLVKLGHVSVDGSKVKANASKHKAMSYQRMTETEARLVKEVEALLAQAEATDKAEDAQYGKGKRPDELPDELKRRESRFGSPESRLPRPYRAPKPRGISPTWSPVSCSMVRRKVSSNRSTRRLPSTPPHRSSWPQQSPRTPSTTGSWFLFW